MVQNANIDTLFKAMEQDKYQKELQNLLSLTRNCTPQQILSEGVILRTSNLVNRVNEDLPSISMLTIQEKSQAINIFIEKNRIK